MAGRPPQAEAGRRGALHRPSQACFRLFLPFKYPPTTVQRFARVVRAGVRVLKLFPRFSMANFKNRLTSQMRARTLTLGNPAGGSRRPGARRRPTWPQPSSGLFRLASGFPPKYPPSTVQKCARVVGAEVQVLELFPQFSMAYFKNRLTRQRRVIPLTLASAADSPGGRRPPRRRLAVTPVFRPLQRCFRLLSPYKDPPDVAQRFARLVWAGVQVLRLVLRFSMANFKNRLTSPGTHQPTRDPRAHPMASTDPTGP